MSAPLNRSVSCLAVEAGLDHCGTRQVHQPLRMSQKFHLGVSGGLVYAEAGDANRKAGVVS